MKPNPKREEIEISKCPTISTMEDLQPSPFACNGDAVYAEEVFEVRGQFGMPRKRLGVLVVRREKNGKLITTVEEHDE